MISVCMATYNGAAWVIPQLESILSELGPSDEVITVDDASTDGTPEKIKGIQDGRIRIVMQEINRGHVATFERALAESSGDYVLLADQDDVWPPGRLATIVAALNETSVVASNYEVLGDSTRRSGLRSSDSTSHAANLWGLMLGRRPYFGCTMGIRREFLDVLLPFPSRTEAHDHWIAIASNVKGDIRHLDEVTVLRREHSGNLTPSQRRGFGDMLRSRTVMTRLMIEAGRRSERRG